MKEAFGVEIIAFVSGVGPVQLPYFTAISSTPEEGKEEGEFYNFLNRISREQVDQDLTRCPVPEIAEKMREEIIRARDNKDSIGGIVTCVVRNMPPGLGEPCFDKLEAKLAHAMLSIPATKGFEIGSGFEGTKWNGSKHNDSWVKKEQGLGTLTNKSAGIQVN